MLARPSLALRSATAGFAEMARLPRVDLAVLQRPLASWVWAGSLVGRHLAWREAQGGSLRDELLIHDIAVPHHEAEGVLLLAHAWIDVTGRSLMR